MKQLVFLLILGLLLLLGCTEQIQKTNDSVTDNNSQEIDDTNLPVTTNDVNDLIQTEKDKAFLESICYYDSNFFDYDKESNIDTIIELAKKSDYNASGVCTSTFCFPYKKIKVIIEEDIVTYEVTEYIDLNKDTKMILTEYVPKDRNAFTATVNEDAVKTFSQKDTTIYQDALIDIPAMDYVEHSFARDLKKGRTKITAKYSFPAQKTCSNSVCLYIITAMGYIGEPIELEVVADKKIVNTYADKFIGYNSQLVAVSDTPTFSVGKLKFFESQKYYYTANKTRIDWVSERIDFAENIVAQKTPKEMIVFFTNSVRSESSFTYNTTNLIILQGDNFDDYFEETLIHEINHQAVTNPYWPDWLHEGIANYLGATYIGRDRYWTENEGYIITDNNKSYYMISNTPEEYDYASSIIDTIISNYGCSTFKSFLYELNTLNSDSRKERTIIESALKKTIGDFTYEDLVNRKI